MENSNVKFKKFDFRNDVVDLFNLMLDSKEQVLFHSRFQINSLPEFEKFMATNLATIYHDFYVIFDESTYSNIGYVYSYEFSHYDSHCKICLFVKDKYQNSGIGAYMGVKFVDELFRNYPLKKIFTDVYDYNKQSLLSNLDSGFVEEGCLKEFRYHNGKYYDLHVLGLSREDFYKKFEGVIDFDK